MAQEVKDLDKKDQDAIQKINARKDIKYANSLKDKDILRYANKRKGNYELADKKGAGKAHWRMIASYPLEARAKLQKQYGNKVFKDEKAYKDILKTDDLKPFLTVPEKDLS